MLVWDSRGMGRHKNAHQTHNQNISSLKKDLRD